MSHNVFRGALLLIAGAHTVLAATPPVAHEVLQEVVVTASPLRSRPLETAQPVSVLAGDDLRRNLAASLAETLAREPGVSSSYYGPVASRPIIRGLTGYRVHRGALASRGSSLRGRSLRGARGAGLPPDRIRFSRPVSCHHGQGLAHQEPQHL